MPPEVTEISNRTNVAKNEPRNDAHMSAKSNENTITENRGNITKSTGITNKQSCRGLSPPHTPPYVPFMAYGGFSACV